MKVPQNFHLRSKLYELSALMPADEATAQKVAAELDDRAEEIYSMTTRAARRELWPLLRHVDLIVSEPRDYKGRSHARELSRQIADILEVLD